MNRRGLNKENGEYGEKILILILAVLAALFVKLALQNLTGHDHALDLVGAFDNL